MFEIGNPSKETKYKATLSIRHLVENCESRGLHWDIDSDDYKVILWLKVWLFQASFH